VAHAAAHTAELEVEPALLSLVCHGLNEKRKAQGKPTFDRALLQGAGQANLGPGFNAITQDPYLAGVQQAGQQAGQSNQMLARNAGGVMDSLSGMAGGQNALGNWINQQGMNLWNTAQDPQKALQNELMQQVREQSRGASSAAGLGTSGVGVGSQDDAMSKFLIDWQNQQLGRQVAGMGGLNSAMKTGQGFQDNVGKDLAASMAAGSMIPGYQTAAGQAPEDAYMQAAMRPFQGLQQLSQTAGGMMQPNASLMAQIIPYLNSGQGATNQAFGQQQTGLNNLTTGLQQFGKNAPNAWTQMMAAFNQPQQGQLNYDPTGSGAYYGGSGAGTYGPS
jgi:hypothetical protein